VQRTAASCTRILLLNFFCALGCVYPSPHLAMEAAPVDGHGRCLRGHSQYQVSAPCTNRTKCMRT